MFGVRSYYGRAVTADCCWTTMSALAEPTIVNGSACSTAPLHVLALTFVSMGTGLVEDHWSAARVATRFVSGITLATWRPDYDPRLSR